MYNVFVLLLFFCQFNLFFNYKFLDCMLYFLICILNRLIDTGIDMTWNVLSVGTIRARSKGTVSTSLEYGKHPVQRWLWKQEPKAAADAAANARTRDEHHNEQREEHKYACHAIQRAPNLWHRTIDEGFEAFNVEILDLHAHVMASFRLIHCPH